MKTRRPRSPWLLQTHRALIPDSDQRSAPAPPPAPSCASHCPQSAREVTATTPAVFIFPITLAEAPSVTLTH